MREIDLTCCQIQEWYPKFRRVSIKTIIHALPEAFVSYLLQDGLFLSSTSEAMPARTSVTCPQLQSDGYERWEEEDEDEDEDNDDEDGGAEEEPTFPELENVVKLSIEELGGSVFPKLNWSAPRDTMWISTSGTLQCKNFGEICLLLKASDRIAHDLSSAFDCCDDKRRDRPDVAVLALRKWYDLRPEQEFRAFVFRKVLVGICQREVTGFYPALIGKEDEFELAVSRFFDKHIGQIFELGDYTFDCYVRKDGTVKLLDFNPWGGFTLPLLFTWEELEDNYARLSGEDVGDLARLATDARLGSLEKHVESMELTSSDIGEAHSRNGSEPAPKLGADERRVEFRIVLSEGMVQPGLRMGTGIPIDFVEKENWEEIIRKEFASDTTRDNEVKHS